MTPAPKDDEKSLEQPDIVAQDSQTSRRFVAEVKHARTGTRQAAPYQVFADRLRDAMTKANINASELARRIWGTTKDKRGYQVARNRDRISHYLAGTSYPEPENLQKLADALGVPVEELAVERPARPVSTTRRSSAEASGELVLTMLPARPRQIRLQCDRVLSPSLAVKIYQMLLAEAEAETEAEPQPGDVINGSK